MNKSQRLKALEAKIIPDGAWIPETASIKRILSELAYHPLTPERFSLAAIHKILKGKA